MTATDSEDGIPCSLESKPPLDYSEVDPRSTSVTDSLNMSKDWSGSQYSENDHPFQINL